MAELTYTTRGVRQRGQKDSWEITFSHKDPITGEAVRTYHTVEAKTRRQALRKRDELVLELEHKGGPRHGHDHARVHGPLPGLQGEVRHD